MRVNGRQGGPIKAHHSNPAHPGSNHQPIQQHQTTTNNPLSPPWERARVRGNGAQREGPTNQTTTHTQPPATPPTNPIKAHHSNPRPSRFKPPPTPSKPIIPIPPIPVQNTTRPSKSIIPILPIPVQNTAHPTSNTRTQKLATIRHIIQNHAHPSSNPKTEIQQWANTTANQ